MDVLLNLGGVKPTIENQELESYTPADSHLGQYAAGAAG